MVQQVLWSIALVFLAFGLLDRAPWLVVLGLAVLAVSFGGHWSLT